MQEELVTPESSADGTIAQRADALHRAFDERFRSPVADVGEASIDILTLHVGDELVGVPVDELVQLVANPKLVRIPDAPSQCIGVAGHRGRLVAVFDLGACLGSGARSSARSMLVSRSDATIAFAVSAVDRYRRVPRSAIVPHPGETDRAILGTLVGDVRALVVSIDELAQRIIDTHRGVS